MTAWSPARPGSSAARWPRRLLADGHDVDRRRRADRLLRPGSQARQPAAALATPGFALRRGRPQRRWTSRRCSPASRSSSTRRASPACGRPGAASSPLRRATTSRATQRLLEAARHADGCAAFVSPPPRRCTATPSGTRPRRRTGRSRSARTASPSWRPSTSAALYARNYGLPTVALRYFTVYGPRQRPDMAFTRFCRAVHDGARSSSTGPGSRCATSPTWTTSWRRTCGSARGRPRRPARCLNVAGGSSVTVNEVLALLGEISGREVRVRSAATGPGRRPAHRGEHRRDRAATGWAPAVAVREGLEKQYRSAAAVPV